MTVWGGSLIPLSPDSSWTRPCLKRLHLCEPVFVVLAQRLAAGPGITATTVSARCSAGRHDQFVRSRRRSCTNLPIPKRLHQRSKGDQPGVGHETMLVETHSDRGELCAACPDRHPSAKAQTHFTIMHTSIAA
jgi:hypothetical protein